MTHIMQFNGPDIMKNILKPCMVQTALESEAGTLVLDEKKVELTLAKQSTVDVYVDSRDMHIPSEEKTIKYMEKCLETKIFSNSSCEIVLFGTTAFYNICRTSVHSLNTNVSDGVCLYSSGQDFAPIYVVGGKKEVKDFLEKNKFTDKEEGSIIKIGNDKWHILEGLGLKDHLNENDETFNVYIHPVGDEAFVFCLRKAKEKASQHLKKFTKELKHEKINFVDDRCRILLYDKETGRRNDNILAYFKKNLQSSKDFRFYIYIDNNGNCYVYSREGECLKRVCSLVQTLICIWSCDKEDSTCVSEKIDEELKRKHLKIVAEKGSSLTYVCTRKAQEYIFKSLIVSETITVPETLQRYLEEHCVHDLKTLYKTSGVDVMIETAQSRITIKGPPTKRKEFKANFKRLFVCDRLTVTEDLSALSTVEKLMFSEAEKHKCCYSIRKQDQLFGSCELVSTWQHIKHDGKLSLLIGDVDKLPENHSVTIGILVVIKPSDYVCDLEKSSHCK